MSVSSQVKVHCQETYTVTIVVTFFTMCAKFMKIRFHLTRRLPVTFDRREFDIFATAIFPQLYRQSFAARIFES